MAFDLHKTDSNLGIEIEKLLEHHGVNTPSTFFIDEIDQISSNIGKKFHDESEQVNEIQNHFRSIMEILNLNLNDDSLKETPVRIAKMFTFETMWGLDPRKFPKCTTVENKMQYDEMVVEKNITVQSVCEHHWQTIDGYATIAYIPGKKLLGLSKMPRVVDYFSRRPQIQERLTEQIFYALTHILETDDVAVVIHANHFCVRARGIQDQNSNTVTSKLGGLFKSDPRARSEFMALVESKL